jgi:hypothetical protein
MTHPSISVDGEGVFARANGEFVYRSPNLEFLHRMSAGMPAEHAQLAFRRCSPVCQGIRPYGS